MTPAEKRIKDLIDRWLASVELHLQYVELNDLAYNRVQPWPIHDRPSKPVLELAKQKTLELRTMFETRREMGDAKFAEAIELMTFLANMVGLQNVQRFIPLADPAHHTPTQIVAPMPAAQPIPTAPAPVSAPPVASRPAHTPAHTPAPSPSRPPPLPQSDTAVQPSVSKTPPSKPSAPPKNDSGDDSDATREMPRPLRAPAASQKPAAHTGSAPRPASKHDPRKAPARGAATSKSGVQKSQASDEQQRQVVADAIRLLNWGRPWHELAEAIARIADRPPPSEVRRILRHHRADIERRAAEPQT